MKTIKKNQKLTGKLFYSFLIILLIMAVMGCNGDDITEPPEILHTEGTMQELKAFYNNDFVNAIIAMGFPINLGNTPPSLEGKYIIDPFVLDYTTVPGEGGNIGEIFGTYFPSFSNQDNSTLTIDYLGKSGGGGQIDNGNGAFVTGSNGNFSVFVKTTTTIGNATAITAIAISGEITPNGIKNIQFLGAMLDDKGDPQQTFIPNNTGRLYIDGDGLSSVE